MTNKELYLEPSRCKQLEEAGIDIGEADAQYKSEYLYKDGVGGWTEFTFIDDNDLWHDEGREEVIPTYRLDKLLLALPEWCFSGKLPLSMSNDFRLITIGEDAYYTFMPKIKSRGQEALNAACDLLLLLKKEGIELGDREVAITKKGEYNDN